MMARRALAVLAMALVVTAGTWGVADAKYRGSDLLGNVMPKSGMPNGSLMEKYPASAYALDYYVDTGFAGTDVTAWPAVAFNALLGAAWDFSLMVLALVMQVFLWAFTLDLINGNSGTGPIGPIGSTMRSLHEGALGHWWIVIGILCCGIWATWVGLVHRRTSELFGGLARSVAFAIIAMILIYDLQGTVGTASRMANQFSLQLLAGTTGSSDSSNAQVKAADALWESRVYRPWLMLQFGGMKTCADYDVRDSDGFPAFVKPTDPARDVCRDTSAYGDRYLAQARGSKERKAEYEALKSGELPVPTPPQFNGWRVSKADAGAVDVQQEGGAIQRVALGAVILIGLWGTIIVLAFLSLAALLVQLLVLALLLGAPLALIVGMIPGWGHAMFERWAKALAVALLLVKPAYALVLGIVLRVSDAFESSASVLGPLLAFGLVALFWWTIFFGRRHLNAKSQIDQTQNAQRTVTQKVTHHTKTSAVAAASVPMAGAAAIWRASAPPTPPQNGSSGQDGKPGQNGHKPDSSSPPASAGREHSPAPAATAVREVPGPSPEPQRRQAVKSEFAHARELRFRSKDPE